MKLLIALLFALAAAVGTCIAVTPAPDAPAPRVGTHIETVRDTIARHRTERADIGIYDDEGLLVEWESVAIAGGATIRIDKYTITITED